MPSPLFLPGGPSTVPGHGGVLFVLAGLGVGFGVGFGVGCGVARGVGAGVMRGVGAGVTRGVGAGVTAGGSVVLGGLVDPAAGGRADGGRGPMATWPLGSGVTEGPTPDDGCVDGGGVEVPGEPSGGVVAGLGLGPNGVVDGPDVTIGVGDTPATSLGAVRGAPRPTVSAKVARTRLRTPRATTSRAR
jgi:hypothetical protein